MSKVVQIDIHGQRYAIRSDLDPQYIQQIAAFLDDKMLAAARELTSADPLRVAVMAALNITDELHRARADRAGVEDHLHRRAGDIERIVDAALDQVRLSAVNE